MRGIITMSFLTIPFCFFDFSELIEWIGLLTVLADVITIIVFIACRIPKCTASHYKTFQDTNENDNLENISPKTQNETDSEKEKDIFEIGCGWFGVLLVVLPLSAVSIFLCAVEGWKSFVISLGLVVALFILEIFYLGIVTLKDNCSKTYSV